MVPPKKARGGGGLSLDPGNNNLVASAVADHYDPLEMFLGQRSVESSQQNVELTQF